MPASFIDTHCHLDPEYLPEGPTATLDRAAAAGVSGFVVIGVGRTLAPARAAVELAAAQPQRIAAAVGVHPHDASTLDDASFAELDVLVRRSEVVAVGEIGLDYHYDHSPRDVQRAAFARLVGLARSVKKPIVIHTREAPADTLAVLDAEGARDVGGLIHCFSEDWAFATRALDLGFDLSFSGIVTYKNATSVHDVAKRAPKDRIHVETDAPYLAPVPLRGKKNEPAFVVHTAKRVAELRGVELADLADTLRENATRRFRRSFA